MLTLERAKKGLHRDYTHGTMDGTTFPLTFRIFKDNELVREESLTESVIKIGSHPSSHLHLDDASVSRMHAIIEVEARVTSRSRTSAPARGPSSTGRRSSAASCTTAT